MKSSSKTLLIVTSLLLLPISSAQAQSEVEGFTKCYTSDLCADIAVPLNYEKTSEGKISIKVRIENYSPDKPLLVLGNGNTGLNASYTGKLSAYLSPEVVRAYSLLAIDDRGNSIQTLTKCKSIDIIKFQKEQAVIDMEHNLTLALKSSKSLVSKCKLNAFNPNLFSSYNSAKDYEVVLSRFLNHKISILSHSYSTLSTNYLINNLNFPFEKVIYDSFLKPSMYSNKLLNYYNISFFKNYQNLISGKNLTQKDITLAYKNIATNNYTVKQEKLNKNDLDLVIIYSLYNYENISQILSRAINNLNKNKDPQGLLDLAYADRNFSQSDTTLSALISNCADYPERRSLASINKDSVKFKAVNPYFGVYINTSQIFCLALKPGKITPIKISSRQTPTLLLSSSYDPAAPSIFTKDIPPNPNIIKVVYKFYGHGALYRNVTCIDQAVSNFLLNKKVTAC